jgi:signal transduction histidine kinase
MKKFFENLLNVDVPDAGDFRRRRQLNILLLGVLVTLILNVFALLFAPGATDDESFPFLLAGMGIFFAGIIGIYFLNRRSGKWAAFLFLLLLSIVINLIDTPEHLASGRSVFVYAFPVAISSLMLFPAASFIFALISGVSMAVLATLATPPVIPNWFAIAGFFMLALVSWLTTRNMEQALRDLRILNRELDQRVEDRTRELSEALMRELVEAGKTQAILQGIADGVLVFDENEKAIAREGRGRLLALLTKPADNAHTLRIEWNEKTLSVNAASITNGMGNTFGTVAVIRDFTREAEIERMKNSFVAMVSHELRTPLNAVLAYAEMLRDAVFGSLNEKQFSASNRIYINSQRLLNIVSDLLDQAQIEAGRLKIQLQKFQTAELIDNLHSVMEKPAQDKGLELTAEIGPEVPPALFGDIHRIQQILVNLVNNAVKFTDKGRISVRIFCPDEKTWAIAVQDTGPGIPLGDQPYVFEAFRQVESITTREHGGIGLGLSIVKRLAILMGGDIALESAVGKGSTFTVTLPLDPSQEK